MKQQHGITEVIALRNAFGGIFAENIEFKRGVGITESPMARQLLNISTYSRPLPRAQIVRICNTIGNRIKIVY